MQSQKTKKQQQLILVESAIRKIIKKVIAERRKRKLMENIVDDRSYTIYIRPHDQDSVTFMPFDPNVDTVPSYLDYDEVLAFSIEQGEIGDETDIVSFCDRSNHIEPYFSSNTAAYECQIMLENDFTDDNGDNFEFDPNITEYYIYE